MFPLVAYTSKLFPAWIQYPRKHWALLQKIVDRIRNSLELQVVLQTAVDEIATLLHLDRCCFLWYFEDTKRVQVVCERINGEQKNSQLGYHPLETFGAVESAIASGKLIINSQTAGSHPTTGGMMNRWLSWLKRDNQQIDTSGRSQGSSPWDRANLFVPVKRKEGWVGFIVCISEQPRTWSNSEIEFLQAIAQQLEIAICQAQLYEQTQKQAQREQLVNQITSQTRQSFNLETILTEAIAHLMQALSADRCLVHLVEHSDTLEEERNRGVGKQLVETKAIASEAEEQEAEEQTDKTCLLQPLPADGAAFRRKYLFEVCREPFPSTIDDFDTHGPLTQWAIQHRQQVSIPDIKQDPRIGEANEEYQKAQIKSSLVVPVQANGTLNAILYLNQCSHIRYWSKNDRTLAQAVADQLAISIRQANLYAQTQQQAVESAAQAKQLAQTLIELRLTQSQLIQSEKMSSLGRMVAGVAHEINNPVNFIYGNIPYVEKYVDDLIRLVRSYQTFYVNPDAELQKLTEELELDFLLRDLPRILNSMQAGAQRIHEIVKSLQNFSRHNQASLKPVDIHIGLENTLFLLHSQLGNEIQIERNYSDLPLVECYPKQLNQVFLSILMNAIEALNRGFSEDKKITLRTELVPDCSPGVASVRIAIADNGPGIPPEIQSKIFDPFFTTKDVGQGSGLGLAVSYQIIVTQHKGKLQCHSQVGQGAEFIVEIPLMPPQPLLARGEEKDASIPESAVRNSEAEIYSSSYRVDNESSSPAASLSIPKSYILHPGEPSPVHLKAIATTLPKEAIREC
ncbi:GAF domain-containing protein [Trichocoleus sp. Lan]|uniref:GAF domain-containing sensor histidine kinase n=1 Tax=Trichocoleus sp. Lan TaxID=2933927 RepID=UPI003298CA08